MFCLDSDCIIYASKGKQPISDRILSVQENELCTTIINQAELLAGANASNNLQKSLKVAEMWFEKLKIVNLDQKSVEIFAKEKARLSGLGKIIDDMDLLIASICVANDLILITNNTKHFARIKNLKIENWNES